MISAGESSGGGGSIRRPVDSDQYMRSLEKLEDDSASREDVQKAERGLASALKVRPFIIQQRLPFFQRIAKALRGRNAFQEFRLTDGKVVVDKRDKDADTAKQQVTKEAAKDMKEAQSAKASESRKEAEEARRGGRMRHGKFVKDKGRLGQSRNVQSQRGSLEQQTASDRVGKLLSKFERMILQRFEEGRQIAHQSKDGKPVFSEKSEAQWSQFFKQFMGRTVKKKVSFSMIQNFLMRGLISKGGKGVFIGDMHLKNGQVEKFIRLSIFASIMARLKGMKPGQLVEKGVFAEMSSEELAYLALASAKRKLFNTSDKATEGKFMGARAEGRAARELGLTLEAQLQEKAKKLRGRRGRGFGGLFDRDPEPEDLPYRFVPWWHWGTLSRPGKFKWFTLFFYAAILTLAIMGVILISMKFMP